MDLGSSGDKVVADITSLNFLLALRLTLKIGLMDLKLSQSCLDVWMFVLESPHQGGSEEGLPGSPSRIHDGISKLGDRNSKEMELSQHKSARVIGASGIHLQSPMRSA